MTKKLPGLSFRCLGNLLKIFISGIILTPMELSGLDFHSAGPESQASSHLSLPISLDLSSLWLPDGESEQQENAGPNMQRPPSMSGTASLLRSLSSQPARQLYLLISTPLTSCSIFLLLFLFHRYLCLKNHLLGNMRNIL